MEETIKIQEYLDRRGIKYSKKGNELQSTCLFNGCDRQYTNPNLGHLYFSADTSEYHCKKCDSRGNIITLAKYFGDNLSEVFLYPMAKRISTAEMETIEKKVEDWHNNLLMFPEKLKWLTDRGLKSETIKKFKLGYQDNWISIPHFKEGRVVSIKYRNLLYDPEAKDSEKYKREINTLSVIFNTDEIKEDHDCCVITEGEFDCMIGYQEGVKNIVAITGGAKTFSREWLPLFDRFNRVYICLNTDTPGQEGAKKIAEILGIDRCYNVVLPEKDLNDFFLAKRNTGELKKIFLEARQFPEAKIITPLNEVLKIEPKEQPFLLDQIIVEGSVNALTSDSGKGKSLVMLKMVEAIVTGEKFLGEYETKKTKTLIMDLEMSENDVVQRARSIIGRELEGLDFYMCQIFNICNDKDFNWLKNKIKSNGYGLVVFDTYSMIRGTDTEENSNDDANMINRRFFELIHDCQITLLFVHHHRKPQRGEQFTQASSRGAVDIIGKTASHLLLDSKDATIAVGEENKIGLPGMRIIVEQMKRRQVKRCERFSMVVWYNPETQKTIFKFEGLDKKLESATEGIKTKILNSMEKGKEYAMEKIKELSGDSSNNYNAMKQLEEEGLVTCRIAEKGVKDIVRTGGLIYRLRTGTSVISPPEKEQKDIFQTVQNDL